jgi:NAD(P)H-dependent flavin oxidoreductase YrpB (nitropropane dioxygenase family)
MPRRIAVRAKRPVTGMRRVLRLGLVSSDDWTVSRLRTRFCEALGIEHPVLSAGIGTAARPELVAAVSNAGGMGVLGAGWLTADQIQEEIARVHALTERPFGVNLIIDEVGGGTMELLREEIGAAIAEQVAALVLFWGDPAPYVEQAHDQGVKLLVQVGSLAEAEAAAEGGVDAVIVQGIEAGGHVRATSSIWELLPAVVEALHPLPVLASGGIGDGAGLARALELGAQAVYLGTRFVCSEEAWCHPAYKRRIVDSRAEDTIYNQLYDAWWPGAPHRTLRNKTLAEWEAAGCPPPGQRPGEGTSIGRWRILDSDEFQELPRYAPAVVTPEFEGDIEYAPLWAGESCSLINDIKPANAIVRDLVRDAEATLPARSA